MYCSKNFSKINPSKIIVFFVILWGFLKLPLTVGLCVRRSIGKTFSPQLKPFKVTKVENIFYSSSVFGPADMPLIVALRLGYISSPPAYAKPRYCAKFIFCPKVHYRGTNILLVILQIFFRHYHHLEKLNSRFYF